MGNTLLLVGGGGHCSSVLDSVLQTNKYKRIGIIDNDSTASHMGVAVVGTDDDLPRLWNEGWKDAFVALGSVNSTMNRRRIFSLLKEIGFYIPCIVDESAIVAKDVEIGEGTFVGKRAVVNAGTHIGRCVIINTGSIIEHDCNVGDMSHISTGAVICGNVSIGKDTHIGANSVVRQSVFIGNNSLIGVGSVVVKEIPDYVTAYGNPCRVVR